MVPEREEFVKDGSERAEFVKDGSDHAKGLEAYASIDQSDEPDPKPLEDSELDESLLGKIRRILQGEKYEISLGTLVLINVLVMALEFEYVGYQTGHALQFQRMDTPPSVAWPNADNIFSGMDTTFGLIFAADIVVRIAFLHCQFFKRWGNWLDLGVVSCDIVKMGLSGEGGEVPINPVFLRMMRLAKMARVVRVIRVMNILESLNLLLKCVRSSVDVLFWSVCLLGVIQCVAGMLISQTVQPYLEDDSIDPQARKEVFRYYGTFSKTILTMSEVLFANWAPPCRVLVDNVSDVYMGVFIFYRCLVIFAVLNVVNAVFVQQTMKVAQADHEYQMASKQKQLDQYCKLLAAFFTKLDESGDGLLSWEEFAAVLDDPKLKIFMSTLDLEPHDLVNLFHMIDGGEGEISIDEFMDAALRLRGAARSIDVAQILANTRRTDAKVDAVLQSVATLSGGDARQMRRSSITAQSGHARVRTSRMSFVA